MTDHSGGPLRRRSTHAESSWDPLVRRLSFRLTNPHLRIALAIGLALAAIVYVSTSFPTGDAAKIQGSWSIVAVEDSGVPTKAPFLMTRQYLFDGRRAIVRGRGEVPLSGLEDWIQRNIKSSSFQLNPNTSPKEFDLFLPDRSTMRGIYDLDGDRLRICFSGPSGKAAMTRPTGFSVPGSGARMLVLERDGK
jgi:uncharacterized protein (TIGR03067 family)